MEKLRRVCVTGAAGYIGSWLVRKLLKRGYIVHATLRNLGDESKVQVLKKLDGADARLRLFEADLYDAEKFELAINGCDFVFLVATPLFHNTNSQYKDTTEVSLDALKIIMGACERSESIKRVIYTASVMSASPRKEDNFSIQNSIDESCWTPLHYPFAHAHEFELNCLTFESGNVEQSTTYRSLRIKISLKVAASPHRHWQDRSPRLRRDHHPAFAGIDILPSSGSSFHLHRDHHLAFTGIFIPPLLKAAFYLRRSLHSIA